MEGKKMQEGDEEIRVGVHIRGSPARASPFPVAAISLMLPRSASITVLKDVVATQHAASARQQPFSLIDPFALIRSAKVIFGGIVLSDTTTLAQAGVQDGASLNLVLASSSSAPSSPPVACYLSSLPRISELHPNVGLTSGGQRVLIVGTNFSRNCTCRFGPVRNLPLNEELLEVIAPPHPTGVVSVQICNPFPLAILRRVMRPTESEDTTETETETEAETDTASPLPGAGASGSWSNDDVLFHYISREQLEREVMVPVGADACREKIAEALYGMGASSINYRRDDEDGFMG